MPVQTEQLCLALIRAELTGAELPKRLGDALSVDQLSAIYALAQKHDLAHIVTGALEKRGLLGADETSQKFKKARYAAVYRYEQLRYELEAICRELSDAAVPHIPLKGAVLRAWYPEPWMRTSCDIDILVKPDDLEKASQVLTERLGYRKHMEGTHDVAFFTPGGLHIELHFDTVEENRAVRAGEVLHDVWRYAQTEDGAQYRLGDGMFYFYHIAHMAKHIEVGGCGIRTFMDLWVLNHRVVADIEARRELLEQGGLTRFAETAERLAEYWFSDGSPDELCLLLEEFVLYGGVYGNIDTLTAVQQNRRGGRFVYLFSLLFPRYCHLKYQYPVLQRRSWLYPFCVLHRLGRKLFGKDRQRAARKWKRVKAVDDAQRASAAALLQGLGLMETK